MSWVLVGREVLLSSIVLMGRQIAVNLL